MGLFSALFGKKKQPDYKQLMNDGAIIIDVRSPGEFSTGHISKSKNIPVDQIKSQIDTIKKWNTPIITVCKSGARSGLAKSILSSAGIDAYNGGPWNSLQSKIN